MDTTITLAERPNLGALYARAAVTALRRSGDSLPETRLLLEPTPIDPAAVAAYNRVCGFRLSDTVPPTYPHIVAFPLAAQLMTDPDFPFALPGLVHIANVITVQRPIAVTDTISVAVQLQNLRPHRRGRAFDIVAEASVDGEVAWSSTNTYLHREEATVTDAAPRDTPQLPEDTTAVWRVPADTGRRYARVSGDRNPIHMSALSARLFGFPRAVAHGMWSKARCLAAVEPQLRTPMEIRVEFAKPLLMPATVAFSAHVADDITFALRSANGDTLHLHGRISR